MQIYHWLKAEDRGMLQLGQWMLTWLSKKRITLRWLIKQLMKALLGLLLVSKNGSHPREARERITGKKSTPRFVMQESDLHCHPGKTPHKPQCLSRSSQGQLQKWGLATNLPKNEVCSWKTDLLHCRKIDAWMLDLNLNLDNILPSYSKVKNDSSSKNEMATGKAKGWASDFDFGLLNCKRFERYV